MLHIWFQMHICKKIHQGPWGREPLRELSRKFAKDLLHGFWHNVQFVPSPWGIAENIESKNSVSCLSLFDILGSRYNLIIFRLIFYVPNATLIATSSTGNNRCASPDLESEQNPSAICAKHHCFNTPLKLLEDTTYRRAAWWVVPYVLLYGIFSPGSILLTQEVFLH